MFIESCQMERTNLCKHMMMEFDDSLNDGTYFEDSLIQHKYDTEEKRIEFLKQIKVKLTQNGGKLDYKDPMEVIEILSIAFADESLTSRCVGLELLCQAIPSYGSDLDNHIGMLFPQLLQNLLHRNSTVKKNALQTLHVYFKNSKNKSIILDHIIHYGIQSQEKALRNEVFLALPVLMRSGFSIDHLKELFISILLVTSKVDYSESTLPMVLCLEHIKDILGPDIFERFIDNLGKDLARLYTSVSERSSLIRSHTGSSIQRASSESNSLEKSTPRNENEELMFELIPKNIYVSLQKYQSWQDRSDAVNHILNIILSENNEDVIIRNSRDLLKYFLSLVEDVNFNVSLTALNIIHKVIIKIGNHSRTHLDLIMKALLLKMTDPKVVVKKINLRIALSLMHVLTPSFYVQSILPFLKHRNTCVREEVLNTITAALLNFPSTDFDLINLPKYIADSLTDPKRRVRHASLECFAILAQQLGSGKLSPLVTAVNCVETREGGSGVLKAVQSRLHRKILPRIDDDGLVQYALVIPSESQQNPADIQADVLWVVSGVNAGFNSPELGRRSGSSKRRFSAGKKKLPWTNDEGGEPSKERKSVNSAPLRQSTGQVTDVKDSWKPVARDSWISSKGGDMKYSEKQKEITSSNNQLDFAPAGLSDSKNNTSYFESYKNKMKKLKQAGLQADSNMINSIHPNLGLRNTLPSNMRDVKQFEIAYKKGYINGINNLNVSSSGANNDFLLSPTSPTGDDLLGRLTSNGDPTTPVKDEAQLTSPVPTKAALARSASKKRPKPNQIDRLERDNKFLSNVNGINLNHTLPKTKNEQLRRKSKLGVASSFLMKSSFSQNQISNKKRKLSMESPFPSRPTIHRTPSGRPVLKQECSSSNLKTMQSFSSSSPSLSSTFNDCTITKTDEPANTIKMNRTHSPIIKTPRAKILSASPTNRKPLQSPLGSPIQNLLHGELVKSFGESTKGLDITQEERDEDETNPGTPKLAKSAQEKLRKLKEERLRQSTDTLLIVHRRKQNRISRSLDVNNFDNSKSETQHNSGEVSEKLIHTKERLTMKKSKSISDLSSEKNSVKEMDLSRVKEIQEMRVRKMKEEERLWKESEKQRAIEDEIYKKEQEERHKKMKFPRKKSLTKPVKETLSSRVPNVKKSIVMDDTEVESSIEKIQSEWVNPHETDYLENGLKIKGEGVLSPKRSPRKKPSPKKDTVLNRTYDMNNNTVLSPRTDEEFVVEGKNNKLLGQTMKPKVTESPHMKRRTQPSSNSLQKEYPEEGVRLYSTSEDLGKPLEHPQQGLATAIELLKTPAEDWEKKCDGLITLRRLARHHPDCLVDFHAVSDSVITEVKNLRSQVARCALACIADFFAFTPRLTEQEADGILKVLLPKAGDTNQFIRSDVEVAMNNLVENLQPMKAMNAIIIAGVNHRNPLVRKLCSKSLADISEKVEPARLIALCKDFVSVSGQLSIDPNPEARYHGRRLLLLLLDHPHLDKLLEKHLQPANLRPVKDVIENLRAKGLGDPPNMSANLRKSVRNPTAMRSPAMSRRSRGISSGGGVDAVSNGDVNSDISENGEIR